MKKLLILAIVIIVAGVAFWFFGDKKLVSEKNLENQGAQENQENQESQEVVLASTSTFSQTDSFYNIQANYPQFTGISPAFNQKIADLISEKIDTFKKDSKENWDARNATLLPGEEFLANPPEPFDFIADWEGIQANDKYLSFVITIYYFTGGAHGMDEVYAFNYDVAQKKEITMEDFLNSSQTALQKISDLAASDVILQLAEKAGGADDSMKSWVRKGAGPKWENFKDFNFSDKSLIIYFQRYQVAAGAFGPVTVILSKDDLKKNLINSVYLK